MQKRDPLKLSIIIISITLGILLFYTARWIILTSLIGIGIGVILIPILTILQTKFHIPRSLGSAIAVLLMLGSITGVSYLIGMLISDQLVPIVNMLPETLGKLKQGTDSLFISSDWIERNLQRLNVGQIIKNSASTLFQGLRLSAVAIGGILYVIMLGAYLASNPKRYQEAFLTIFPTYSRGRVLKHMSELARTLRRWFLSQLVSMITVGIIAALSFWIIDIEYWLLIGALSGILEFVPYAGPILAALTAGVITLSTEPDKLIWVVVVFTVIQQLEGNLITPIVMKLGIDLPPVHLLIFVLTMTTWFGLMGTLVGPPLFAVARTLYLRTYAEKTRQMRTSKEVQPLVKYLDQNSEKKRAS